MHRILEFTKSHWVAVTLLTLSAVTALSLWPLSQLPLVPGSDKTHHVIAYAFLMLPVALRKPNGWMVLGLVFIFYSGGIELLQPMVNRYGEWPDLLANTAGVILGALLGMVLNRSFAEEDSRGSR